MNESNNRDKTFRFPEELRNDFIETYGLDFKDDTHVSSEDIWNFMSDEAPIRFPLTLRDRLLKAHKNGTPIIHVQGGQTVDPYYAAGGIPIVPGPLRGWARDMKEGMSVRDADRRALSILEAGRQLISIEACNNPIAAIEAIHQEIVPVDLIAPFLCLRCTDIAYIIESYRSHNLKVPVYLIDYPITQDKEWTVTYLAALLRRLVKKIGELKGTEATEEDLKKEIKLENKGRRFARETIERSWSASTPPINSTDIQGIIGLGRFSIGDSLAGTQVLEGSHNEVKERVKHSIKGAGLEDDPVRILSCGSCFGIRGDFIEEKGGIHVGTDDHLNKIYVNVEETGDPFEKLAECVLSYPYEQTTENRAEWVIDLVNKSRADGLICGYNWGCNYQSGISRMLADIVKEETGIPTINIEVAELGRLESVEQTQNRIESFIEVLK